MTRMHFLSAAAALLCSSCLQGDSPIRVLGANPLDRACTPIDRGILAGSLDLAGGGDYQVQFTVQNELVGTSTTSGGQVLASAHRNDWVGSQLVFTYASTPSLSFETELVPVHYVIEAGSSSLLKFGLIAPKAAQRLADSVPAGNTLDLSASFEIRGKLFSGQQITTTKATFPIFVFNSGFSGCAGDLGPVSRNGPCGTLGGQDGIPLGCCRVSADGGVVANPDPSISDGCSGT